MSMNGDLERQIRPSGSERQLGPQQMILELQGPKGKGGQRDGRRTVRNILCLGKELGLCPKSNKPGQRAWRGLCSRWHRGVLSISSHHRAAESQRHKPHSADLLNNMASPCPTAHVVSSLLGPSTTLMLPPSEMWLSVHCALMVASKASSQGVLGGRILMWSQLCSVNSSSSLPPSPSAGVHRQRF